MIVQIGDQSDVNIAAWAAEIQSDYGLPTFVAARLPFPPVGFDESRNQWPTDALLSLLEKEHGAEIDKELIVIGVTAAPLYFSDKPEWRFTFGSYTMREPGSVVRMHGVMSTDIMRHKDGEITKERLSKLTARFLGTLHCGFERGNVPDSSPMRSSVLSDWDLDAIDRGSWAFPTRPPKLDPSRTGPSL